MGSETDVGRHDIINIFAENFRYHSLLVVFAVAKSMKFAKVPVSKNNYVVSEL